ncbi:MAG: hypothetical protein M3264_12225 [Thermoproteota archaeon]|nr:hypothetical protein [Thermoproteota archaeon]
MILDICYDKPWGASSGVARDIRSESRHGEGEIATVGAGPDLFIYDVALRICHSGALILLEI